METNIFNITPYNLTFLKFNSNIKKLIKMPQVMSQNDLLFEVSTNHSKIYSAYILPDFFNIYNNSANVRIIYLNKISKTHYKLKLKSLNGVVRLVWIEFNLNEFKINTKNNNNKIYHYFDDNGFSMTKPYQLINFYLFLDENNNNFEFLTITSKNFQIKTI